MAAISILRYRQSVLSRRGIACFGYAVLLAVLVAYYISVFSWGNGLGVDFACFRAAATIVMHGGNPYDFTQLWRMENALYNVPHHLRPGDPSYYYLDKYYNPPLFAVAMEPFARLPFGVGYAIYTAGVVALAVVGAWLTLTVLDWRRFRPLAVTILMLTPPLFFAVRNGQQSTLLLFLAGAALYALRRGRPGVAGALLGLSLVKPHLLVPFALAAPLLLPSPRDARRWYAGFFTVASIGSLLTIATTGPASIVAWIHRLIDYSGVEGVAHTSLPSLSGMSTNLLSSPWDRIVSGGFTALGMAIMVAVVAKGRHGRAGPWPWAAMGVLLATWLLFTPYAHANDGVLLLLPLATAWGRDASIGVGWLPLVALLAVTVLPLAFLLPYPLSGLTVLPALACFAASLWTFGRELRTSYQASITTPIAA